MPFRKEGVHFLLLPLLVIAKIVDLIEVFHLQWAMERKTEKSILIPYPLSIVLRICGNLVHYFLPITLSRKSDWYETSSLSQLKV